MEVAASPAVIASVYGQLRQLNAVHKGAWAEVVSDYTACLHRSRELQVRCAQLDREAGELRAENESLLRSSEEARRSVVASAQHAALEARAQQLSDELTGAYKEKAALAEASLQATRQLQVVRDINERQSRELTDAADEARKLKEQMRDLRSQLEHYKQAHATVSGEMQARLAEAQAATAKVDQLAGENAELVRRVIEMKDREAERLNDMNAMASETVARAKQEAAGILAEARAQALTQARRPASEGAEMVQGAMRSLGLGDAAEAPLPAVVMRSFPGTHEGGCYGLAFSRNGGLLASGGADKCVRLWEPSTATLTATLHGAFEGINAVAFTNDSRLVLGAENKQAVRVWDVSSGRLRSSLTGHSGKVMGVGCSPADANVVATCSADRTIKVWGLERGYCIRTLMSPSSCNSLAITADGSLLASGHFDGALRFWDVRSGRQVHEVAGLHSQQITSVAVGPSGGLVLTCGKDNLLRCVDVRRFEMRHTLSAPSFSVGGAWTTACLSPTEHQASAGSSDGTVFVWDVVRGTVAARLRAPKQTQSAVSCAWCPLGLPLVSCDKAGGLTFWSGSSSGGGAGGLQSPGFAARGGRQHSL